MRALHIIDSLNRGGAEVMLTAMAPKFRKWGVTCDIVALMNWPSPLEQTLRDQGVSLRYTGVHSLNSPRQVHALSRFLLEYDIIHVHLFPAQLWTVLAASSLRDGVPLVTTEHNTWNARRRWWMRPIDAWMYRHYDRIACISDATAESLIQWCPGVAKKITVIPNGVSLDVFENARPAALEHVPDNATRLVFVGRCDIQKDHKTLLRALVTVPDAHLLLVGDGPLRPQLERLAQSLGVADRVSFLGLRTDVAEILKASDIYVHSTHSDGFGLAACEAMAAGLPVVATDVPGLAQVVGEAGTLVPEGDARALAESLNALIKSPARRQNVGQACLSQARQFSIEKTVQGYIRMYESVLGAPKHSLRSCDEQS
jgi:glycosyltransferase involved in cell wall biosynthesis